MSCYTRQDNGAIFCEGPKSSTNRDGVAIVRPDGKKYTFSKSGAAWIGDADVNDRITASYGTDGITIIGWTYVSVRGDVTERYDATGLLLSITTRAGTTQRMTYSNGATNDTRVGRGPADAPACSNVQAGAALPVGRLLCVTDHWGRQLQFEYDPGGRITKAIDPSNQFYLYEYDGPSGGCLAASTTNRACSANNLTKVTYPDHKSKTYFYNEAVHINGGVACANTVVIGNGFGGLLNQLTGIVDENGVRYSSWTFDCQGRTTSNELAGGVGKATLAYGAWNADNATTTVTHYLGTLANPQTTVRSYTYQKVLGIAKNAGIDQPCAECGPIKSRIYDAHGNVVSQTDFNGNKTTYVYDLARNQEMSSTEGFGTAQARTITTAWHPTYRLPIKIAEPLRITTNTYDAKGNLLNKSVEATSDATGAQGLSATSVGSAKAWAYTYNDVGQVLAAKGPRTDLDDTTRYAYDAATGNLQTITNAAGHITILSHYDANGRVGRIVDANGLTTDLAYYPRGWLKSRTVTGNGVTELTSYGYDGVGQLKKVSLPDGSWIGYDYDDAHRLTDTYDSLGNRISYTLDAMGNRISEQVTDPSGALARQTTRVYDALNRLQAVTGAGP
ncbi:MAG: hypothetical protein A3I66_19165 [Burkholderiales bacterium RIFCSPLOWO2_02_FULL_57_36]|nr:MAG: hypothetical protein A3I66_19165 [Burkholderiales bacterium RIFCSPLOWO2_02_FULL_57_36]